MKRPYVLLTAAALLLVAALSLLRPRGEEAPRGFFEAEVAGVMADPLGLHSAVILLPKGRPSSKAMAILVGGNEGSSIAMSLAHRAFPRPLTHDLMLQMVDRLEGRVRGLYIHSLQRDTFFARLEVGHGLGVLSFDCRPSDGMAIALRAKAPIWVHDRVFESSAIPVPQGLKPLAPRDEKGNRGGGI